MQSFSEERKTFIKEHKSFQVEQNIFERKKSFVSEPISNKIQILFTSNIISITSFASKCRAFSRECKGLLNSV